MKTEFPKNKPAYKRWADRLTTPSIIHSVPAMMAMECECLVVSYHGGFIRAAWHIFSKGIGSTVRGWRWAAAYRLCDYAGWTKLRDCPNPEIRIRHGASCDKLNCDNIDCCTQDIPRWYKRLSGIAKFEEERA